MSGGERSGVYIRVVDARILNIGPLCGVAYCRGGISSGSMGGEK